MLVKNPEFVWECWADDPTSITAVEAELDGKPISVRYDSELRRIIAKADFELAEGQYSALLRVRYRGGGSHEKAWTLEVSDKAVSSLPGPDTAQKQAFETANTYRSQLKLPSYLLDDRINAAGLAHSRYLTLNNTSGHDEKPGMPGFTGKTHRERLEAYGYVGTAVENVASGCDTAAEAIQSLVDAPYHRLAFLQPGKLSFGTGMEGRKLTMTCSSANQSGVVVYPADGQRGVPTSWSKPENPDPLAIHGATGRKVGYPIVLAIFTADKVQVKLEEASLNTADGRPVETFVNSPANDKYLDKAFILIPREPLRPNSEYLAKVIFSVTDQDGTKRQERSWSFRTQN